MSPQTLISFLLTGGLRGLFMGIAGYLYGLVFGGDPLISGFIGFCVGFHRRFGGHSLRSSSSPGTETIGN